MQRQHPPGGNLEPGRIEDLAADMGVQPEDLDPVDQAQLAHCLERRTVGDGEAELLILMRGGNVFVGVRFHTRGHSDHDPDRAQPLGSKYADPLDLVEGVHHDPPDACGDRAAQLGKALVVSVVADLRRIEVRPQGNGEFPGEQTSRLSPSSATQRATAVDKNALPA